jgi:uncharacterized membrane protein YedE/YeeE
MVLTIGGFLCGLLAGFAARYGRLCSMSAVEDAVIGGSWRGLKAWGLALAVAIMLTHAAAGLHLFNPATSIYATTLLDWPAAIIGGLLFGIGMALTGTCSFGLLVRLGGGDLRALVTSLLVGISAFAFAGGILSSVRFAMTGISVIELGNPESALLPGLLQSNLGTPAMYLVCGLIVCFLVSSAFSDGRLLRRPRLLFSGAALGVAVASGWIVTSCSYMNMDTARIESLSFVAPTGRILLEIMSEKLQDTTFGVVTVLGVICGSLLVAAARNELQWEAFDDAREMRRHMVGAVLMGSGGVLAKGCTIGQGLTAGSVLSVLVPLTLIGIFIGAKIGLAALLLEPSLVFSRSK